MYERATGVPIAAVAMMSGFGETVAPRIVPVRVNGVKSASDVRRASTVTSQTPACGFVTVRDSGLPAAHPATAGGTKHSDTALDSIASPNGCQRRNLIWPVPGVVEALVCRSTLKAGVPAGMRKK